MKYIDIRSPLTTAVFVLQRDREERECELASLADYVNTMCREASVEESKTIRPDDIKRAVKRLLYRKEAP